MHEDFDSDDKQLTPAQQRRRNAMRLVLVLLAVAMLAGGVYLNGRRIRQAKGPLKLPRHAQSGPAGQNEPGKLQTPPPPEVYPWLEGHYDSAHAIYMRIPPPPGFQRPAVPEGSFAHWLRFLPLVNRRPGPKHPGLLAWVDLPALPHTEWSSEDLPQRLLAEYLHAAGRERSLAFATSPDSPPVSYTTWLAAHPDPSDEPRAALLGYLREVLPKTTTLTLSRDLAPAEGKVQPGEVWHHPPAGPDAPPGHAVIVADVVEHPETGQRAFLLLEASVETPRPGVLVNPADPTGSPWYNAPPGVALRTPGWTFLPTERNRFAPGRE